MLTRLSALLHPLATVGQVNAALQDTGARISFLRSGSLVVTLKVPRLADLAAAQTLSDALGRTGTFLSVSPALSPVIDPPEEIEPEATTLLLPGGQADAHIAHLQAIAAPSAWNLRRLVFDVGAMVPVLVPDAYVRARTSTKISNLTFVTDRETTTESGPNRWCYIGNHGWRVVGTIGADFDEERSMLTLNLLEAGPSSVTGDVTMANGARSSASGP
jgi:hypothetical protein